MVKINFLIFYWHPILFSLFSYSISVVNYTYLISMITKTYKLYMDIYIYIYIHKYSFTRSLYVYMYIIIWVNKLGLRYTRRIRNDRCAFPQSLSPIKAAGDFYYYYYYYYLQTVNDLYKIRTICTNNACTVTPGLWKKNITIRHRSRDGYNTVDCN